MEFNTKQLEDHVAAVHSEVTVEIIFIGVADRVDLMYNNLVKEMVYAKGEYCTSIDVMPGKLCFCFVINGKEFRVANNHQIEGGNNVVEVKKSKGKSPARFCCSGYSFLKRLGCHYSQYSRTNGSSACTAMAMYALTRTLKGYKISSQRDIHHIIDKGYNIYEEVHKNQKRADGVEHLSANEVFTSSTTVSLALDCICWEQGDSTVDKFEKVKKILELSLKHETPIGAVVTTSCESVAVWVTGGETEPCLFDSHSKVYGDDNLSGASLILFKDIHQLTSFLSERFALDPELYCPELSLYDVHIFGPKKQGQDPQNCDVVAEKMEHPIQLGDDSTSSSGKDVDDMDVDGDCEAAHESQSLKSNAGGLGASCADVRKESSVAVAGKSHPSADVKKEPSIAVAEKINPIAGVQKESGGGAAGKIASSFTSEAHKILLEIEYHLCQEESLCEKIKKNMGRSRLWIARLYALMKMTELKKKQREKLVEEMQSCSDGNTWGQYALNLSEFTLLSLFQYRKFSNHTDASKNQFVLQLDKALKTQSELVDSLILANERLCLPVCD